MLFWKRFCGSSSEISTYSSGGIPVTSSPFRALAASNHSLVFKLVSVEWSGIVRSHQVAGRTTQTKQILGSESPLRNRTIEYRQSFLPVRAQRRHPSKIACRSQGPQLSTLHLPQLRFPFDACNCRCITRTLVLYRTLLQ